MKINWRHFALVFAGILSLSSHNSRADVLADIKNLKPGEWYEIPNSKMRSVVPNPMPAELDKNEGVGAVIWSWSGGAFDTKRDRLIVWGGGHSAYGGNEVYVFDVYQQQWQRLTDPSSLSGMSESAATMPDGNPKSVHSYDQLEYLPIEDKFFATGGSVWFSGKATDTTWFFDFDTNQWQRKQDIVGSLYDVTEYSMTTAYDPVSNKVILSGYKATADFDPATNTWRHHKNNSYRKLGQTGALDPVLRKFVTIGRGEAYIYDVDNTGKLSDQQPLNATGATEIEGFDAPGLTYDYGSGKLVAWGSGANVYSLDLGTRKWTKHLPSNSVTPGDPYHSNYHGTFGRFRYIPSLNAFVVVTDVDENVFIYKLTSGAGAMLPSAGLSVSQNNINSGDHVNLVWSAVNADSCSASTTPSSGLWTGTKALANSEIVGPVTVDTIFTLTCTKNGMNAGDSASVTVASTSTGGSGDTTSTGGSGDTTSTGGSGDTTSTGGSGDTTTTGGVGTDSANSNETGNTTLNAGAGMLGTVSVLVLALIHILLWLKAALLPHYRGSKITRLFNV
jgi:hypothetical protein